MHPIAAALTGSKPAPYWTDVLARSAEVEPLTANDRADLVVVGGGFSGLWAAYQHLEDNPGAQVRVVEAERVAFGASGRNGGFCAASLTHGLFNGMSHWPDEISTLVRMGNENLDAIEATVHAENIACGFERTGEIDLALEPWQAEELEESVAHYQAHGETVSLLNRNGIRSLVHSPTYLAGLRRTSGIALVDPARLAAGLASAIGNRGGVIFEDSAVTGLESSGHRVNVAVGAHHISADRVVVATNAYAGPVKRARRYVVPVYDHVIMTEPLTAEQRIAIGWQGREGLGDAANQFHYYRLTEDNRILFGGYDATYHFGNGLRPELDLRDDTHAMLARHFFATFPQLEGLQFSHRWGGPIGTTSRFTAAWGTSMDDKVAWVAGYTGLGVGASRFGARVALDLLDGSPTERTELEMVRRSPLPFPPEPLRWAGIQITKKAIQRSDRREGRRGAWLTLLDKFGVGFDS
ncbi:MAG: glycine/D-amino acid oxidase-like deaminating enzyme [Candidatus Poriferisodalaceae bacterium]|jgi:glycine/D-amino acid oxidase-like deaminating enzyme